MTIIDFTFVGLVALSACIGLIRGFTKEVLSLLSWIGAVTATLMFWPLAQHVARQYIQHPMLADGATILALFILFLVLFSLISYFLSNLVRQSVLGGIDRSLGMLFGVLRGALVICLMEMFVSCFVTRLQHPDILKTSRFSPVIYRGSDALFSFLPYNLKMFVKRQQLKYAEGIIDPAKVAQSITIQALPHVIQSVEEMAKLSPKALEKEDENMQYSKKQRQDVERLLTPENEVSAPASPPELQPSIDVQATAPLPR